MAVVMVTGADQLFRSFVRLNVRVLNAAMNARVAPAFVSECRIHSLTIERTFHAWSGFGPGGTKLTVSEEEDSQRFLRKIVNFSALAFMRARPI